MSNLIYTYNNPVNVSLNIGTSNYPVNIIYNPEGDIFYCRGRVTPFIYYFQFNTNKTSANLYPLINLSNNSYFNNSSTTYWEGIRDIQYNNGKLYINMAGYIHTLTLSPSDYITVTSVQSVNINRPNYKSSITINPYSKKLYLSYYTNYFDTSYNIYDLSTDLLLNSPEVGYFTGLTGNPNYIVYQPPSFAFDQFNNVYYNLSGGIYRTNIDSSFNFATSNQTLIIPSVGGAAGIAPGGILYNPAHNYIYTSVWTTNRFLPNVYTRDGTLLVSNYTNINYLYPSAAIDKLYNVFFFQSEPFSVYIAYKIVCFKEDTQILTSNGYRLIQELKKGDLVKTLNQGYKPIYKIGQSEMNHLCSEERIKEQLYKCSTEKYPELFEDLVITGCHCILVDEFTSEEEQQESVLLHEVNLYMTEGKYRLPACVDKRTSVYEVAGTYNIYHFALENDDYYMNDGVYANGLLVESTSKRFMDKTFTNLLE